MEIYIIKTVDKEPLKPENWARLKEMDECYTRDRYKTYSELNAFLKNPETKEKTIALIINKQKYIKYHFGFLKTGNGNNKGEIRYMKTLKK